MVTFRFHENISPVKVANKQSPEVGARFCTFCTTFVHTNRSANQFSPEFAVPPG